MGQHKLQTPKRKIFRSARLKPVVTTAIIVACIVGVVALDSFLRNRYSPLTAFPAGRSVGNPDAPLKILEFADFQCAECKKGFETLNYYLASYPKDIYVGMKYFPLLHEHSMKSAVYAECAAEQKKFWPFVGLLFKQQNQWSQMNGVEEYFRMLAKKAELNADDLENCVKRDQVRAVIAGDKSLGDSYFVRSTPTYFINKEMVVGVEALVKYLENYFKNKK